MHEDKNEFAGKWAQAHVSEQATMCGCTCRSVCVDVGM